MPKGYWVSFSDKGHDEVMQAYVAAIAVPFRKYGARFLIRNDRKEVPEGSVRPVVIVIEFPTYAAALECYRSPEYAKALALRANGPVLDLAITEGFDGPQFSDR